MIAAADKGDGSATKAVFAALYSELHERAKRGLGRYGAPVSLSPTTLLHQAYLDMADREGSMFPDAARFIAYAARVMRGLIIDHACNHQAKFERTIISVVGDHGIMRIERPGKRHGTPGTVGHTGAFRGADFRFQTKLEEG